MAYSVSQNTSLYTAASILQKAVSFIYFTIVARAIGVNNTGIYFFAISFTTIFTVVADCGLAPVLTREAAKYPEKSRDYFLTIFWIKVFFGIISYLLVVLAIELLHYDPLLKTLILLSGITMFFDNLQTTCTSIFRAHRTMWYESIGIVFSQSITLVIGLLALYYHWPLWSLIVAYTIASGCTLIYFFWKLQTVYGIFPALVFNRRLAGQLLVVATPFAVAGIIGRIYSYADAIMMSKLLDPIHLGWWSVPYKMTFAFQFIAVAVSTSVYPVMSALSLRDTGRIAHLFERAWKYLFLVSLPLACGLGVLARPLIMALYGAAYAPSVPVLQILLVSLVFGFLSFVTGATLNATNNQKKQTILLSMTLVLNLLVNFWLIPRFGIQGAAMAALVGNCFLAVGGLWLVKKVIPVSSVRILQMVGKIGLAAAGMGWLVHLTIQSTAWYIGIPVGLVVYPILLILVQAISRAEFTEFKAKFFSKAL